MTVRNRPNSRTLLEAEAVAHEAARWSRLWLICGLALLLLWPEMRGYSRSIGWLPFWLAIAPLIVLARTEARSWTQRALLHLDRLLARPRLQAVRIAPRR
jgi:hypothetical protein